MAKLSITNATLEQILAAAREAGSAECLGLLAAPLSSQHGVVSAACLLPATASRSHAVADPLVLKQAADAFRQHGLKPLGLWHSHGSLGVFHSGTDDHMSTHILPAMALWNVQRSPHFAAVPVVTESDAAALPLSDGRLLRLMLQGPPIPGDDLARERVAWTSVKVGFSPAKDVVHVVQDGDVVRLSGGGVCLTLGLPDGAQLATVVEDGTTVQSAHLFSLVVNRRGEQYCELIAVHTIANESFVSKAPCEVVVTPDEWVADDTQSPIRILGADLPRRSIRPAEATNVGAAARLWRSSHEPL